MTVSAPASGAAGANVPAAVFARLPFGAAADQRFLILDEPTSVLTPAEADEILGLLHDMAKRGEITVLVQQMACARVDAQSLFQPHGVGVNLTCLQQHVKQIKLQQQPVHEIHPKTNYLRLTCECSTHDSSSSATARMQTRKQQCFQDVRGCIIIDGEKLKRREERSVKPTSDAVILIS